MPKVLNQYRDDLVEMDTSLFVYIGRGSEWGNPFILKDSRERAENLKMFEKYAVWRLKEEPNWLVPLRGKNLVCFCAPKQCHGDTLLELANR